MISRGPQKFQAIYFDLFNTLLHFDFSLLPEVRFNGKVLRTTTVEVYRQLDENHQISIPYDRFLEEFLESKRIIEERIRDDYREFSCLERFRIVCERLGIEDDTVAQFMVDTHMGEMFRMMYFPEENRAVLDALSGFPCVLISNFDHGPTARRALRKFGLEDRFQEIFISDEVGWRKPGAKLFQLVLNRSRHCPQCCLYVGDDPWADVYGASREGFQVVWLAGEQPVQDLPVTPQWTIHKLPQLVEIVSSGV